MLQLQCPRVISGKPWCLCSICFPSIFPIWGPIPPHRAPVSFVTSIVPCHLPPPRVLTVLHVQGFWNLEHQDLSVSPVIKGKYGEVEQPIFCQVIGFPLKHFLQVGTRWGGFQVPFQVTRFLYSLNYIICLFSNDWGTSGHRKHLLRFIKHCINLARNLSH